MLTGFAYGQNHCHGNEARQQDSKQFHDFLLDESKPREKLEKIRFPNSLQSTLGRINHEHL